MHNYVVVRNPLGILGVILLIVGFVMSDSWWTRIGAWIFFGASINLMVFLSVFCLSAGLVLIFFFLRFEEG